MSDPSQGAHCHADEQVGAGGEARVNPQDAYQQRQPDGAQHQPDSAAQDPDGAANPGDAGNPRGRVASRRAVQVVGGGGVIAAAHPAPGQQGEFHALPEDQRADQSDQQVFRRPAAEQPADEGARHCREAHCEHNPGLDPAIAQVAIAAGDCRQAAQQNAG